ncbi:uncharacterized protein A1O9_11774 [Exophiala aquamarina CBS 119918]|uniref:Homeobox domain-containing protein n=1 Tax=Exophiala aquamarina CBS 119918 TaxID=1182545 RepID=A0A072NYP8_9EURO|nr:uncharacterized protein A1O9_11774 [Exophiala aquamarina CBS 119918]KEF52148.1 hypothetical protein A1O9_11774 [Exophiala aquamarina CBS 119918]
MDHYTQSATRPYTSQPTPVASQTRLDVTHPEQQLPSIRDVIPPPRSNLIETSMHETSSTTRPIMVPYLSSQHTTSMNVSSIPAPVQPQSSPMGYPTDATNQMQMSALATTGHLHTPARTPAEYSSPWSTSSSYTDAGMSMSAQPSLPSQPQQFGLTQAILPSDSQDSVFSSSYSMNRQAESPVSDSYPRWRTPQLSSTPRYNPYVMSERSYTQALDYGRYGQAYDQYRSPVAYDGGYRSMDVSPSYMKYNQLMSYPMMGYPPHANGRRRRGNLPKQITDVLRIWLQEHLDHPYPSDEQKQIFIQRTGLTISQISNWFINARRRQLPAMKLKRAKALQSRS